MLARVVEKVIDGNINWFFARALRDHYDRRREAITDANKNTMLGIDYILRTCIEDDIRYPPDSVSDWLEHFRRLRSHDNNVFQQLLLVYLKLDASNYLSIRERESSMGKTRARDRADLTSLENTLQKLLAMPDAFDFSKTVVKLATGLWAMDNEQISLMISCLSDPLLNLADYFECPGALSKIIVDSLILAHNPRMALYMSRIHRYENEDEDFDSIYAFLLISSGRLVEALKYERTFADQTNYNDILRRFFELCWEWKVTKSLNCLNLSVEEEEALNQQLVIGESRPTTPSSSQNGKSTTKSTSKPKQTPRNRGIQNIRRQLSFNDSPAKNTRSARKNRAHPD